MKKLIHVKKHLRKGKTVKSHSRKGSLAHAAKKKLLSGAFSGKNADDLATQSNTPLSKALLSDNAKGKGTGSRRKLLISAARDKKGDLLTSHDKFTGRKMGKQNTKNTARHTALLKKLGKRK